MEYKLIDNTYVVRLDVGDEIIGSLATLCKKEKIQAATVQGLGAVDNVTVGYYSIEEGRYLPKTFNKQFEMIALNGNISVKDNEPYLHLHIALSDESYAIFGGHLNYAVISITAEIFVTKLDGYIGRRVNEKTQLNIFDI
jgi:predicted DNA-binding protein with PD1-like motif